MINSTAKNPLILIVDDIPKNLQVLSSVLDTEGYQISFASNGKQALSVVETTLPDLILLDIMMPEMDGFEVCQILKSNPKTQQIPVIFLTGKAETEDIVRGFEMGAIDYITKPFNAVELLIRVKTHLDLKFSKDAIDKYAKDLEKSQEELKQVIASKDKFFSIIAHDLRGPFSGFLGLSELLVEEYNKLEPEEVSQIADSMNKAAKRLFEFLENLLEWARSQMGKMEYNPIAIDINQLFMKVSSLMMDTAKNKSISILYSSEPNLQVQADHYMINTIMRNLVSNAIKFTKQGGKVELSAISLNDDTISIEIKDSGVGMNNDTKARLFSLESKYSTPGTANESGTGLGLILCKELIDKNFGKISVESILGEGTTFTVQLPKTVR